MPTRLTLHVIDAGDVPVRPPLDALGGTSLPEWFRRATDDQIVLDVVEHKSVMTSTEIDGAELQAMFREFVPSPAPGALAPDIGLLFCRSWCFRDLAGLMFDYDGADMPAGARVVFDGVPRQACAVFLDAQDAFSPADQLYVAIHELGHVFNLHHDPDAASFMGLDVAGPRSFREPDRAQLKAAGAGQWPEQHEYLPGGAPFQVSAASDHSASFRRSPATRSAHLVVAAGQGTFLPGEPVVLDVSVTVPPGVVPVAGGLEPGYDGVRVWYRTPLGEIRVFSPIRRYCPISKHGTWRRRAGRLKNNMRIHLNRRGFTLIEEGTYQVWVELDVRRKRGQRSTIASRAVAFTVARPHNELERAVGAALADPQIARFVANKGGPLEWTRRQLLEDLSRTPATKARGLNHIRYALARASHRAGRNQEARNHLATLRFSLPSLTAGARKLARTVGARRAPSCHRASPS